MRFDQSILVKEKIPIRRYSSQNKEFSITYKDGGLYLKFLLLLKQAEQDIPTMSRKSFIPYSNIYQKICRNFSITKKEAFQSLLLLENQGIIDFIKFKGVKLNYVIN